MDLAAFIQYLKHERLIMDHLYMSASAILVYDYLLTLPLEIKYIWFSRWRYTEVMFLLIRYMSFVTIAFALHNRLVLNVPADVCRVTGPLVEWLLLSKTLLAESVLAIRTWAVWRRNRAVGVGLAALMVVNVVVRCVKGYKFENSMKYFSPPYSGFRGCYLQAAAFSRILEINYGTLTGVEAIILGLMTISAFRLYRHGNSSELSHVIHRDGIQFYVCLLLITAGNVGMIVAAPPELVTALTPMEAVLYSVFTCRVILSIRDVSNRGKTELHTTYHDSLTFVTLRRFPSDGLYCQFSESTGAAIRRD